MKTLSHFFLSITLILLSSAALHSQSDGDCYDCHDDHDISMDKNGRKVSLTIKRYEVPRSVHAKLKCVDCHFGFDPFEIPHKEKIEPISCKGCHGSPQESHRFHPQINLKASGVGGTPDVNCKTCHGTHSVKSPKDPKNGMNFYNSVDFCGTCHADVKRDHISSVHYTELQHNNPNAPTCAFCHNKPITKSTGLTELQIKINTEKLCLDCHLHNNGGSKYAQSLVKYEQSVHGQAILKGNSKAAVCVDCHGSHKLQRETNPESRIHISNVHNVCGKCHTDITKEYMKSIHGIALSRGIYDSPSCSDCHGEHNIHEVPHVPKQAFSKSGMNFDIIVGNKMVWCVSCHSDQVMMKKYNLQTVEEAHKWLPVPEKHWKTVRCVDCHSSYLPPNLSHDILPRSETVKQCEQCHSKSSILMTKLFIHEKKQSRDKYGFINGTILSDAYLTGATRNVFLEIFSYFIFGSTALFIAIHGGLRYSTRRKNSKKH